MITLYDGCTTTPGGIEHMSSIGVGNALVDGTEDSSGMGQGLSYQLLQRPADAHSSPSSAHRRGNHDVRCNHPGSRRDISNSRELPSQPVQPLGVVRHVGLFRNTTDHRERTYRRDKRGSCCRVCGIPGASAARQTRIRHPSGQHR